MNQLRNCSNAFVPVPTASVDFIEHWAANMGMLAENLRQWVAELKEYKEAALAQLEQGRIEGLEEGKRELLLRQIETKYGTEVREQLTETLLRHTTTEALDRFGDWIIKCESAEELFQRIRASSNGIN